MTDQWHLQSGKPRAYILSLKEETYVNCNTSQAPCSPATHTGPRTHEQHGRPSRQEECQQHISHLALPECVHARIISCTSIHHENP